MAPASPAAALLFLLLPWLNASVDVFITLFRCGLLALPTIMKRAERAAGCGNVTALSAALDTLLAEYERAAPPGGTGGAGTEVRLALDVRHAAVRDATSAVRLLADLRMRWTDERLAWNATEWGCDSALVAAERLWLPDVALLNGAPGEDAGAGDAPLRARLTSDGRVASITRLDVTVPVSLALTEWPRDSHTALFQFASRAHTIDELDLIIEDLEYATVFESGAWEILRVTGATEARGRAGAGGGGGTRRVAGWLVSLRRRAPAHAAAARAVLFAAVLLLLAAALLPPAARAPLCACASLTASLWLISALVRLPASGSTPRAMSLMCALSVLGAAACAGAALAARLARCAAPAPPALRACLAILSSVCKLTPLISEGGGAEGAAGGEGGAAWAAAARLLDRALLAALLLALLVVACLAV